MRGLTLSKTASSSANPRAWISGPGDDLAGAGVDHDDDGDEALLAEDAPVLEVGLGDLADAGAVDVDVAALDRAGDPRDAVDEVDDDAVLGDDDPLARHARSGSPSSAFATRWRTSPCTGMTLRGRTML